MTLKYINDDIIRERILKGDSIYRISKETGWSVWTVRYRVQKMGLKSLHESSFHKYPDKKFNHDFFENIETESQAYWLGFMCADGCVQLPGTVSLGLAIVDRDHLIRFNNALDSNCIILDRPQGKTIHFKSSINFYSRKMVSDLCTHECTERKSLTLCFPIIFNHLIHHFIRGYFDGDGSISWEKKYKGPAYVGVKHDEKTAKLDFCGTPPFLHKVRNILDVGCKIHQYSHSKACSLRIGGSRQVKRIGEFLYRDATIYLPRKRDRFNALLGPMTYA